MNGLCNKLFTIMLLFPVKGIQILIVPSVHNGSGNLRDSKIKLRDQISQEGH